MFITYRLFPTPNLCERAGILGVTFMPTSRRRPVVPNWRSALEKHVTGTYTRQFQTLLKYKLSTVATMKMCPHTLQLLLKVYYILVLWIMIILHTFQEQFSIFPTWRFLQYWYWYTYNIKSCINACSRNGFQKKKLSYFAVHFSQHLVVWIQTAQ